jgi:hypothetical protein
MTTMPLQAQQAFQSGNTRVAIELLEKDGCEMALVRYCQLIEVSWREQILRGPCQILDATNPSPFIKCSFTKYSVITGFHMMSAKSKQVIDNTVTR